jgi:transcriptional regulator with PAS, ATPase and Fis domain
MTITVPPLRDRRDQILPLSQYFFNLYKTRYGKEITPLSPKTIDAFIGHDWPGNMRELENMIKRIVLFGQEETVLCDFMRKKVEDEMKPDPIASFSASLSKGGNAFCLKDLGKQAAETAEKEVIQNVLQETHWNRKEAAKILRVSYKALLYKIEKYHLNERKTTS